MRGVNDSAEQLLDLCFALQDEVSITTYYFYMRRADAGGRSGRTRCRRPGGWSAAEPAQRRGPSCGRVLLVRTRRTTSQATKAASAAYTA